MPGPAVYGGRLLTGRPRAAYMRPLHARRRGRGCCAESARSGQDRSLHGTRERRIVGRCGVVSVGPRLSVAKPGSEQCLPPRGKQPHERASFAGWRASFCPPSAPLRTVGADSISARARMRIKGNAGGYGIRPYGAGVDAPHRPGKLLPVSAGAGALPFTVLPASRLPARTGR